MWTSMLPIIVLAAITGATFVQFDRRHQVQFKSDQIVVPFKSTKDGQFVAFDLSDPQPLLYITFEMDEIKHKLELVRVSEQGSYTRESNTRNHANISSPTTPLNGNEYIKYTGSVRGVPSQVQLTVNSGMQGIMEIGNRTCVVEYVSNDEVECRQNGCPHVLYCHRNSIHRPILNINTEEGVRIVRNRRSIEGPVRYIETLVVGEFSMTDFYKDTVTDYIKALIFKVNEILQDETIGINIQIIITKIVIWNEQESANKIVEKSLKLSRSRVCSWARMNQDVDEDSEAHHDLALFLTRKALSKSGYEQNGHMCSEFRSCALVQDEGFPTSFVIAQEIGHLLGLLHDDDNGCADDIFHGSVMSKVIRSTFIEYLWSNCSRMSIKSNIRSFACLRDHPLAIPYPQPNKNIGETFSMDDQCKYIYEGNYTACPWVTIENRADPCNILLCHNPAVSRNCLPEKRRSPPLDGTECAPNMWCLRGRCLAYKKRNGAWSSWSAWGPCSKSCGIGVSEKTRKCDNPPPLKGGRRCRGKSKDFRLCNADDCVRPTEDFREVQCQHGKDPNALLVPYITGNEIGSDQCKLSCVSLLTGTINKTRENVIDGTRCNYDDTNSVCVNGDCLLVGCNGIRGSKRVHDVCGVCGGDGTSCHQSQGYFNGILVPYVTESITVIPRRSREIVISKPRNRHIIFVIKDPVTKNYVFESSDKNDTTGFAVWAGTRFAYELGRDREFIAAKGPLLKPIHIIISSSLGYSRYAEVRYQYVIPNELEYTTPLPTTLIPTTVPLTTPPKPTKAIPLYRWESYGWSDCTKTCGGGWRYFQQECRNTKTRDRVDFSKCDPNVFTPMSIRKPCNEDECPAPRYLWETTGWQRCSKRCGAGGIQTRSVQCVRVYNGTQISVRSSRCEGSSPPDSKTCNQRPCPAYWETGKWSQCSVTCGLGVKMRSISCAKPDSHDTEYICYDSKPKAIKQCLKPSCDEGCKVVNNPMCGPSLYETYCNLRGYRKFCCRSCDEMKFIFSQSKKKKG